MLRIFYIHGVNSRRELGDMFEGAPGSGGERDGIAKEYSRRVKTIVANLARAAGTAGFKDDHEIVPVYWGDLGGKIRYYRPGARPDKPTFEPVVQNGVPRPVHWSGGTERTQGTAPAARDEREQDMFLRLESIAGGIDHPAPTLRDLVLAEPRATLTAIFGGDGGPEEAHLDARITALARRLREDAALRAELEATDPSVPGADGALLERIFQELEGGANERRQGKRHWALRPFGAAASAAAIPTLRSARMYSQGSRTMGDALIYFQRRGTRAEPGPIVARVLGEIRAHLPEEPDGPTVFVTHSLGCTILYDIFTHFDPSLHFDLWVSVGSQLSLYEEVKILANSGEVPAERAGSPGPVKVTLPKGARWYNVLDPRDPLAYASASVFEGVRDEIYPCKNNQVDEIHNAYLEEERIFSYIEEWLGDLTGSPAVPRSIPWLDARVPGARSAV
jgi:hypothetical protein